MIRSAFLLSALAQPALAHDPASLVVEFLDGQAEVIETSAGATPDTLFVLASVGKAMTAVAALRLVEDGALDLDAEVAPLVPRDVSDGLGGLDGVTLRHLLTMTSGLPDYLSDDFVDAALDNPGILGPEDALAYAFDEPQNFAPGTGFDYSNTNYVLVQILMTEVTGDSYAQIMADEVFVPAGMTGAFVFGSRPVPPAMPDGHEDGMHVRDYYRGQGLGDGGTIASARDLYRFYDALLIERSLLGGSALAEMLRDESGEGYGMGLELDAEEIGHSGGDLGFSSDVRLDVETGAVWIELFASGD